MNAIIAGEAVTGKAVTGKHRGTYNRPGEGRKEGKKGVPYYCGFEAKNGKIKNK